MKLYLIDFLLCMVLMLQLIFYGFKKSKTSTLLCYIGGLLFTIGLMVLAEALFHPERPKDFKSIIKENKLYPTYKDSTSVNFMLKK